MDFKKVDKKYRPIPFWSWNEKLNVAETKRQIGIMDDAGIGGFFMHARGGLLTEYMGDEWFDNVNASIDEGKTRGMHPFAYDENGWPSGFGGGRVNGKGEFYQQKMLRCSPKGTKLGDDCRLLREIGDSVYYYVINPLYVDTLDEKVVADFISEIYEEYYEKVGNGIDGIFTDEPQMNRDPGYPWSNRLAEIYEKTYGESLIEHLDSLFFDNNSSQKTRFQYWKLVTRLFSENFFKQIYDWCTAHGYSFTGHQVLEENFTCQMMANGACMPHYEYFTIPGMDWLCRHVPECLTPMQLGSAAAQTGKKQVLSETFALCGHNVSHDELKWIYEWQMVHGVNLLCTHLEGYSLRGIRKRDYPPAMYYQQPWWADMRIFFDAVSRIGMLLSEGEITADTLLIHPQSTAWLHFDGNDNDVLRKMNGEFLAQMRTLERKHIRYHLGDETLMERHGSVEDGKLVVGKMRYSRVILPKYEILFENTERLLAEFRAAGGIVTTVDEIPDNPVIDVPEISYTMRSFPDFDLHYYVNSTTGTYTAHVPTGTFTLDPVTGDVLPFDGTYTFGAYESLLVLTDKAGKLKADRPAAKRDLPHVALPDTARVVSMTQNSLTLDRCDYAFDGEPIAKGGYVLDILPRINELRRPVRLTETFRVTCESVPDDVSLCTETPALFDIRINGKTLDKRDAGWFVDPSFRLLPIPKGMLRVGENEITLESTVSQSQAVYDHIENSWAFETMKNCLSYDTEIEQIYLVGHFGTRVVDAPEELDRGAYRIAKTPVVTDAPKSVRLSSIDRSGFTEFAGTLTLGVTVASDGSDKLLAIEKHGFNSVTVAVNGTTVGTRMFGPYEFDLSGLLRDGDNELTITLRGNLRNMQGPFHLKVGESYEVAPASFFRESNVFSHGPGATESNHSILPQWSEDICLVHTGVKGR